MANTKSKKTTSKKTSSKPKAVAGKSVKTERAETATTSASAIASKGGNPLKGFFAKKCDKDENILTIFKSPRIWGALVGELVGTMLLTILMITLGVYQPLYILIGVIAITMAVYAFSGAHLNPAVTVGMMATRRVSAIRGVLYIVAQIVGAWLGLIIMSGFRTMGEDATELPAITALTDATLWKNIFIEFLGAAVIGFFFCRAQSYRTPKGAFTYAAVVAGGLTLAVLFAVVISSNYVGLSSNFVLNPAIAIMEQIFPFVSDGFGELMGSVAQSSLVYILIPMIGAVGGFFLADASKKLSGEE
ncbi:MAG: aquaporin [Candidatus Saccharibacteria bacterium]|nr:aquaporin [Candidatus Saccharibacteria bacterium]